MATLTIPPADFLRQILDYNPDTGELRWKPRTPDMFKDGKQPKEKTCHVWNGKYSGKIAANRHYLGYIRVSINGVRYNAHRVIWAMMGGDPETPEIDHINGDPSDNRWRNLRGVDRRGNTTNTALRRDSSTGITGVYQDPRNGRFFAMITSHGKQRRIGTFDTKEAAAQARKAEEMRLGFHPNHGRQPHSVEPSRPASVTS